MALSRDDIETAARLAALSLDADAAERRLRDLAEIFDWIAALDAVDVDDVEPLAAVGATTLRLRDDDAEAVDRREALLAGAPDRDENFFLTPKIVE